MSTVKEIETAIKELPRDEFMSLANRIAAHQADLWEKQPDTDEDIHKLDFMREDEEEEHADYELACDLSEF
jgi:hypothetical protein